MLVKRLTLSLVLTAIMSPSGGLTASPEVADEPEFSRANTLLFLDDHLTGPEHSARYVYSTSRTGSQDSDFDDRIIMTAHPVPGSDVKRVAFDLSAENGQTPVPPVERARGNPMIMVFLQSDVLDLAEATGGHWRYFQKHMKLALEHDARVEPVIIDFQGKRMEAYQITVQPYANDQDRRNELGRYRHKTYEFVLSDELPGEIFELRSITPAEEESEPPIIRQVSLQAFEELPAK